jgi:pSer/pThr/pTyr-binding forkhead associated (FHA) protein
VVQLKILSGKMAGSELVARHFPFRIGRSATANLRVEDPGMWDEHLVLSLTSDSKIELTAQPGALASLNGETITHAALRNGDLIQIGAVQLQFGLSPTRQKGLQGRETLVWSGLALLCLFQVAVIYWLLSG